MKAVTRLSAAALWGSAVASAWAPQFGWNSKPQGSPGPSGPPGPHGSNHWNSSKTQGSPWPHPTSHPWSPSGVLPQNATNGLSSCLLLNVLKLTAWLRSQHMGYTRSPRLCSMVRWTSSSRLPLGSETTTRHESLQREECP
jgi:hypothetical protein